MKLASLLENHGKCVILIVSFEEKAMNPNRTAMATMTSAYALDDVANMLKDSFVTSNIIKSYD